MIIGKVIGSVISTRKHDLLVGNKFLIIELLDKMNTNAKNIVAVDTVGAGIGDCVLVVTGSSARVSLRSENTPIDAAIVGIIDEENDLKCVL